MKHIILLIVLLSISTYILSQKPKNGTYLLKYFDIEYNKFAGVCKLVVNDDSVTVYAVKDCYQKPGALIEKGVLIKNKSGDWIISTEVNEDVPSRIDFKKEIYYTL